MEYIDHDTKITCLFGIKNEDNQPSFNLECWFYRKPSIEELLKYFNVTLSDNSLVLRIVKLWGGEEVEIPTAMSNILYRLQEVSEKTQMIRV